MLATRSLEKLGLLRLTPIEIEEETQELIDNLQEICDTIPSEQEVNPRVNRGGEFIQKVLHVYRTVSSISRVSVYVSLVHHFESWEPGYNQTFCLGLVEAAFQHKLPEYCQTHRNNPGLMTQIFERMQLYYQEDKGNPALLAYLILLSWDKFDDPDEIERDLQEELRYFAMENEQTTEGWRDELDYLQGVMSGLRRRLTSQRSLGEILDECRAIAREKQDWRA